ncbi:unnamed protein product [Musa acuminata subsp. burmannicoides]
MHGASSLQESGHPQDGVPDLPQIPSLERPAVADTHREGRLVGDPAGHHDVRRDVVGLASVVFIIIVTVNAVGTGEAQRPRTNRLRSRGDLDGAGRPPPSSESGVPLLGELVLVAIVVGPQDIGFLEFFHQLLPHQVVIREDACGGGIYRRKGGGR